MIQPSQKPKRIGDILIDSGLIDHEQLKVALVEQKISGKKLGQVVVDLGFISEQEAQRVIGDIFGIKYVDLSRMVPDHEALRLLPEDTARKTPALPLSLEGNTLQIALTEPDNILLLDRLKRLIGNPDIKLVPVATSRQDLLNAIDRFYGFALDLDSVIDELVNAQQNLQPIGDNIEETHPLVRLVNAIIAEAVKLKASDIHMEPEEHFIRIRYRIDGVLQQQHLLHKAFWSGMAVRIKVLSEMDMTETRLPQDGRMEMIVHGRRIFFRVSTLPTLHGENIVLRILDKEAGIVPLVQLGLETEQVQQLQLMMAKPEGIILITGPTGSGKTTTLYSILNERNDTAINIMTLEDPVEYQLELIRQTQVNEEIGLTFANGIRTLLRQDPDVILVGEVRDADTAEMAFRAAMTGHQVMASLHTNSAIGAFPRLLDLGVHTSVIATNIIGIIAQRLVRKLCEFCKTPYAPDPIEKRLLSLADDEQVSIYRAQGCEHCNHTGYKGRVAIMEILRMNKTLDELILQGADWNTLEQTALNFGFQPLHKAAAVKILNGVTSLEEATRVIDFTETMQQQTHG